MLGTQGKGVLHLSRKILRSYAVFFFCLLTVQLRDHMGHLYAAKDLRLHFTEPVREPPSPEKVEKLLADNVHWSERGMFREGKSGPVVKIRGFEAPGS